MGSMVLLTLKHAQFSVSGSGSEMDTVGAAAAVLGGLDSWRQTHFLLY